MSQSVNGKIKTITQQRTFGTNTSKSLVIETNDKYPQTLEVEFVNDKIQLINDYKIGDDVDIKINIRGREWTSPKNEIKYFISLKGWAIDKSGVELTNQQQQPTRQAATNDSPF